MNNSISFFFFHISSSFSICAKDPHHSLAHSLLQQTKSTSASTALAPSISSTAKLGTIECRNSRGRDQARSVVKVLMNSTLIKRVPVAFDRRQDNGSYCIELFDEGPAAAAGARRKIHTHADQGIFPLYAVVCGSSFRERGQSQPQERQLVRAIAGSQAYAEG